MCSVGANLMILNQSFWATVAPALRADESAEWTGDIQSTNAEDAARINSDPEPPHLQNPAVLVVDDDEVLRSVICKCLARAGYEACGRACAKDAIQFLSSRRKGQTILVTDLVLHGSEGGWSLAQQVRQLFPAVSIVLMSGYIDEAAVQAMMTHGNISYLPKPFELGALVATVAAARAALSTVESREQTESRDGLKSVIAEIL